MFDVSVSPHYSIIPAKLLLPETWLFLPVGQYLVSISNMDIKNSTQRYFVLAI